MCIQAAYVRHGWVPYILYDGSAATEVVEDRCTFTYMFRHVLLRVRRGGGRRGMAGGTSPAHPHPCCTPAAPLPRWARQSRWVLPPSPGITRAQVACSVWGEGSRVVWRQRQGGRWREWREVGCEIGATWRGGAPRLL